MRFAAIDQGTTSTRVMVVDESGRAQIVHSIRHLQIHPQSGWVEHNPNELLENIKTCLATAGKVDAIGIANQGESCLAWDALTGEPLSPVIVWQDNRTSARIDELSAQGAEDLTLARCGLPLDAYFSASKLAWLLQNVPQVQAAFAQNRLRLATTDAFFLERLTGQYATDITTASRTGLMNLATGQWDADLCELYGVPIQVLPPVLSTVGDFGHIDSIPVTASVVDQQASLYGHGCREVGDAKITFGTGAFALTLTGSRIIKSPETGLLATVAWQIKGETSYAMDGGVYDASSALEWAGRLGLFDHVDELAAFDAPAAIGRKLAFVPALSGLACPHWDRSAAGTWIGMSASTSRLDMCQSVLEGVALRAAQVVQAMSEHMNVTDTMSIDGGLARNPYFAQFLADVLQRTIVTQSFDELTAFGCAALAARGCDVSLNMPEATRRRFVPQVDSNTAMSWQAIFSQAVERSKGWR